MNVLQRGIYSSKVQSHKESLFRLNSSLQVGWLVHMILNNFKMMPLHSECQTMKQLMGLSILPGRVLKKSRRVLFSKIQLKFCQFLRHKGTIQSMSSHVYFLGIPCIINFNWILLMMIYYRSKILIVSNYTLFVLVDDMLGLSVICCVARVTPCQT